jgi:hypothetical protein
MLLPGERLARCVDFHRRDPAMPGCDEVLAAIVKRAFAGPEPASQRLREIRRVVQAAVVRRLVAAAALPSQTPAVRAALETTLRQLSADLARGARGGEPAARSLDALLAADIDRWLARPPGAAVPGAAPEIPPGPPIGSLSDDCDWSPPQP